MWLVQQKREMKTLLEKPADERLSDVSEQTLLEKEFGELFEMTLRLEYKLEAVVYREN